MVGRNHPLLRRLRTYRRDRAAPGRDGVVVAEGVHLVSEALAVGLPIEAVLVSPRLSRVPGGDAIHASLRGAGVEPLLVDDAALDAAQDARSAQPVVALVRMPSRGLDEAIPGRAGTPLVVIGDGVQDPGNLGALLRAADAAGATGLVVTGASADLRHPRLVRATMGSLFRLPAARGDAGAVRDALVSRGLRLLAADPRKGEAHVDVDWRLPTAVVLGGEGPGLDDVWRTAAGGFVRIPMRDGVESLSVPVAGAVLLFEADRQRRLRPPGSPVG